MAGEQLAIVSLDTPFESNMSYLGVLCALSISLSHSFSLVLALPLPLVFSLEVGQQTAHEKCSNDYLFHLSFRPQQRRRRQQVAVTTMAPIDSARVVADS